MPHYSKHDSLDIIENDVINGEEFLMTDIFVRDLFSCGINVLNVLCIFKVVVTIMFED